MLGISSSSLCLKAWSSFFVTAMRPFFQRMLKDLAASLLWDQYHWIARVGLRSAHGSTGHLNQHLISLCSALEGFSLPIKALQVIELGLSLRQKGLEPTGLSVYVRFFWQRLAARFGVCPCVSSTRFMFAQSWTHLLPTQQRPQQVSLPGRA